MEVRNEESDHGFSACRPWLVRTVTDWLVAVFSEESLMSPCDALKQ